MRLEIEHELVVGQRMVKILVQFQAHDLPVLHALGVELIGVAALFLGTVERHIGIAQQGIGIQAALRIDSHAHSGSNTMFLTLHGKRLFKALLDLAQQIDYIINVFNMLLAHHELIAAGIGHHHFLVAQGIQAFSDFDEQFVAELMAERIVERLEPVQVDHHQRCLAHLTVGDA